MQRQGVGRWSVLVLSCVLALGATACSSDDDGDDGASDDTTPERPLRILVANDDGYDNPGLDALVEGLFTLDDVELAIVAPQEERSGTGATTTPGGVEAIEVETPSGRPAYAQDGFPADSIAWALDGGIDFTPDVVVTGVNPGQNFGLLATISGTVNSALLASENGVPALAVSLQLDGEDFTQSVDLAVEWVSENRDALLAGEMPAETWSINVPDCPTVKELVEVPNDRESDVTMEVDCDSTLENPTTDIEGFANGYAVISFIEPIPVEDRHTVDPSDFEEPAEETPAG